jgi:hypothetical protein
MTLRVIAGGMLAAGICLLSSTAYAQRRVAGQTIHSDSLPSAALVLDTSLSYLGTQRFVLYNVANAEQFFFAELDGKRIKRYVWIQFEGYLPDNHHTYDYSQDSTIQMWNRTIYHNSALRETPRTESRPESDGARARQFLRERGLTLGPRMLYHRLVWLLDQPARNELMIIYMEDPADYGAAESQLKGNRLQELLKASLARAERSIRFE